MARKMGVFTILAFTLYGLFFYWYLFKFSSSALPFEYQGTSADPATFLNGRELGLSEEYSKTRNLLFFLSSPWEWLFYILIMLTGLNSCFKQWAEQATKRKIFRTPIYLFWFSFVGYLAALPLGLISYSLSKTYNISTQTFPSWMKDELIDFWINYGTLLIIVPVLYYLLKRSQKRWWLFAWMLSVPFTLFMMFVQPVLIDPLYNDFYPLKNKELEAKILTMADKAKIPAEHVFEVNMAEKTNAMNAYVNGIGSNSRIVLWDTTLNRLTDDQILFIMAHEMGHYVEKHLYIGIAGYLLLSLVGLYLAHVLMQHILQKWSRVLKVPSPDDIRSLPLILLILSVLMFGSSPLSNAVSRYQEARADQYAINMTKNPQAAIGSFQELTRAGLSQVNPPFLVKQFRYGHPTMLERISMLEEYQIQHRKQ
ncbi:M48 family peptidase [Neobacillus notoginsengisoli]|uniref:M48 family peptidase n=1 Tax=Neobacillus notoginsengisoli TaxID=1578198 RepID=A0A417YZ47_9BACI|nr:M48 family metallopeptidase [Neobacillus notoginsengisoli]RHW43152.1 M48 family peptidase [Neobacillus notoginsengisoli]